VVSDKAGTRAESKLAELFAKAEVLGAEVRVEHDRMVAVR
jgi:hypothetical protein